MNINIDKLDVLIILIVLTGCAAYLGAYYADNNWKHDLRQFSQMGVKFSFDDSGKLYTIYEPIVYNLSSSNIIGDNFTICKGKVNVSMDSNGRFAVLKEQVSCK